MLTFKAHPGVIDGIAFSPDGQSLAVSRGFEPVQLWSFGTLNKPRRLPCTESHVAFSPNGRFFGCAGFDFQVWEIGSQEMVVEFEGAQFVAFAPNSKEVATVDMDDVLIQWSLPKGELLSERDLGEWPKNRRGGNRRVGGKLRIATGPVTYSPDGKELAVVLEERVGRRYEFRISILGRKTGKPRLKIVPDFSGSKLTAIAYSPDGSVIAGICGPVLGIVSTKTGKKVAAIKPGKKHFKGLAFTPDGKRLIAVNNDAAVRVYDTTTWTETTGYEWQIGKLTAVAVAPDGLRAACGSDRGQVVVWDLDV